MNPIDKLIDLDRESRKRILVVGDPMTDRWHIGTVGQCQEDCPHFLRTQTVVETPGGAANAKRQLQNWRSGAILYSKSYNYPVIWCIKNRYVDEKSNVVFRHDEREDTSFRKSADPAKIVDIIEKTECDAVLISDYDKGELTVEAIPQIIEYCINNDIPIVADGKRAPEVYAGAVLKVNEDYQNRFPPGVLSNLSPSTVVTLGKHAPIVFSERGMENIIVNPKPVPCINHVGAGDCFAAHLTLALAHGIPLTEAVSIAHAAGRVFVQHKYGRPPWPHEIRKDLDPLGGKVIGMDRLAALRQSNAGRIVFTNGVFDLLGSHHLYLLQEAKKSGDILVVGINDDESVKRLKGPKRPVVSIGERLELLQSLEFVDWVVPFPEDTPENAMRLLCPDVLVKADFPERNRVGDNLAGQVKLIVPKSGLSTTNTLNRIIRDSLHSHTE